MSSITFFEGERHTFFRPLHSSRRELVVACLRALYERLHGPAADYAHNLTRETLKELLLPVVREHLEAVEADGEPDEFNGAESRDPQQLTSLLMRVLLRDGWLEQFPDRQGLVTAFRFSRPGVLFAEVFWSLNRPSQSRQRNMRSCRNSLDAALAERGDAHDLVDAYEYAVQVNRDLSEGIDYFQELLRRLMREATLHSQWDEFVEFLERFRRNYSKQLTADNATLNREAIRQKLERLRSEVPGPKRQRMEEQLHDIAQWAVREHTGGSVYDWLLDRIDDVVNAACESKQPGFIKAMDSYLKRVAGLVQQSMMLRSGQNRHAWLAAIQKLSALELPRQERLLAAIGERLSFVELRLLDPSSFRLRSAVQRRKAVTVSIQPRPSREARLEAAMKRAETEAFAVANEELADKLREDLKLFRHPIRLSSLPVGSARELLQVMQAVEAVRNARGRDLVARPLPGRLDNEYFSGADYEIDLKK
ncbi:DUF5716 family protein [Aquabacterium sp. A7-Y]|uniref:Wadjet anti-phage system protein JetA family protein n=1 Tax=Aquabacterium sp. A7-Y TaxID=1349605 RepID=UPI00223D4672|nr:Wadjet anti-phage system protein JetA family protein [Aquabacterium sp. A7-Y]MCW7537038.1 DUF5716 family protein [Aquabacterium sp. A7-Y]